LGDKTTVGAGLITANLRLDGTQVHAMVSEKKRDTNKRKMGIITGENVHLGVRVTTMPGTLIGANSTIYPGLLISRTIENNSIKKV
jgi:bifunctional UDP-N-acetylglucosamine pyrophosphorylase/glucosamine-1-phosphate N-acetyltransferase